MPASQLKPNLVGSPAARHLSQSAETSDTGLGLATVTLAWHKNNGCLKNTSLKQLPTTSDFIPENILPVISVLHKESALDAAMIKSDKISDDLELLRSCSNLYQYTVVCTAASD